jgi:RNA polymerase sigma-70 factor (ECF subfamily)
MQSKARVGFSEELLAHRQWVQSLSRQLVRDDALADDVVQETWLAALQNPPRPESARPWLRRVLRTKIARARRTDAAHRGRERRALEGDREQPAADATCERAELATRVASRVKQLREPYREAVRLRYLEGLPPREIAVRLGMPVSTVLSNLQRGRSMLREALEPEYGRGRAWGWALGLVLRSPAGTRATRGVESSSALPAWWVATAVSLGPVCLAALGLWLAAPLFSQVSTPLAAMTPAAPGVAVGPASRHVTSEPEQPARLGSLAPPPAPRDADAHAQRPVGPLQPGDVVVTSGGGGHGFALHVSPDGTPRAVASGPPVDYWVGNTLVPGGWACLAVKGLASKRHALVLFDAETGRERHRFPLREIMFPADLVALPDGTLAVSDRGEPRLERYAVSGEHLGTIELPGEHAGGLHLDPRGRLWAIDPVGRQVHCLDPSGSLLSTTPVDVIPGDVASAGDGSFWVTGHTDGLVLHVDLEGRELERFDSGFRLNVVGIALAPDGTVWVSSLSSREVRRFRPDGRRVGGFICPPGFQPECLSVSPAAPPQ